MAIPEGGVGGPLGVAEQLDVGVAAPELDSVESVTSCRAADEVFVDAGRQRRFGAAPRRVGLFVYV
jgi:hypothetical protein